MYENQERHAPRPSYGDAAEDIFVYAVSAQAMRERLDAMGFTVAPAHEDYRRVRAEDYELYLSPGYTVRDRKKVKDWTYDRWAEAIARLVPQGFQISNGENSPPIGTPNDWSNTSVSGLAPIFLIRAFCSAACSTDYPTRRRLRNDACRSCRSRLARPGKELGKAPTQAFAETLIAEGHHGLLVPSFVRGARADDLNLVLWKWDPDLPAQIILIDDDDRLSRI